MDTCHTFRRIRFDSLQQLFSWILIGSIGLFYILLRLAFFFHIFSLDGSFIHVGLFIPDILFIKSPPTGIMGILFPLPYLIFTWIVLSSFVFMLGKVWGGRGDYTQLHTGIGFALGVPLFIWEILWIVVLICYELSGLGNVTEAKYYETPFPWILYVLQWIIQGYMIVLMGVGIAKIQKIIWWKGILVSIGSWIGLTLFYAILFFWHCTSRIGFCQ